MQIIKKKYHTQIIVLATTLLGQVYIRPFETDFRISIGIIVLTLLLLKFENVSVFKTCLLTGISILIFRTVLDVFSTTETIQNIILSHYPSLIFYLMFGVLLSILNFRKFVQKPTLCLLVIAISDVGANVAELIVRVDIAGINPEFISSKLIFIGIVRAIISYLLFFSDKVYILLVTGKEQKQKYKEFIFMRANIKSEMFFMKKSMEDIEVSMKESFSLYRELNEKTSGLDYEEVQYMKNRVLDISKGIHELKKDYQRVVIGLSNVVPDIGFTEFKNSKVIFEILQDSTDKYIKKTEKNIGFEIVLNRDFPIFEYLSLISILNNLIVNSVDAIKDTGLIKVKVTETMNSIELIVSDNGSGIKEKNIKTIFNPGFSTKFDEKTGEMSTGIGLSHVKELVENYFKGTITVESKVNDYTLFRLEIPRRELCLGGKRDRIKNTSS